MNCSLFWFLRSNRSEMFIKRRCVIIFFIWLLIISDWKTTFHVHGNSNESKVKNETTIGDKIHQNVESCSCMKKCTHFIMLCRGWNCFFFRNADSVANVLVVLVAPPAILNATFSRIREWSAIAMAAVATETFCLNVLQWYFSRTADVAGTKCERPYVKITHEQLKK